MQWKKLREQSREFTYYMMEGKKKINDRPFDSRLFCDHMKSRKFDVEFRKQ